MQKRCMRRMLKRTRRKIINTMLNTLEVQSEKKITIRFYYGGVTDNHNDKPLN